MRGGVLLLRRDDDGAPHFTLYPLERVGAASASVSARERHIGTRDHIDGSSPSASN
jgi:hypothetical protein